MKRIGTAVLGATLAVAAACGGDSATGTNNNGAAATINASAALVFAPNSVNVQAGQSVAFQFGAVEHNVTFTAAAGVPENIGNSASTTVLRTFNTVGTYVYHCTIHAGMGGQVVVGAATGGGTYGGYLR